VCVCVCVCVWGGGGLVLSSRNGSSSSLTIPASASIPKYESLKIYLIYISGYKSVSSARRQNHEHAAPHGAGRWLSLQHVGKPAAFTSSHFGRAATFFQGTINTSVTEDFVFSGPDTCDQSVSELSDLVTSWIKYKSVFKSALRPKLTSRKAALQRGMLGDAAE